jgi:hypothetical protein
MGITNDIALYSMEMPIARVAGQVQTSIMKNAMEIEQDMMSQLFASMGVGGALNVQG